MEERVIFEPSSNVRVVSRPGDPPSRDLAVQMRWTLNGEWGDVRIFNDMSDDHAHTRAKDFAVQLAASGGH